MILAENFDILLGKISITVPLVVEASDYQILCRALCSLLVLVTLKVSLNTVMGDSGNDSPDFTIQGSGVTF